MFVRARRYFIGFPTNLQGSRLIGSALSLQRVLFSSDRSCCRSYSFKMDDDYDPVANGGGSSNGGSGVPHPKPQKKLTVEKVYQKKSQLEHILLRPDTYIGSVERVTELMWVVDREKDRMVQKEISYVPGLYKIFDEILVNAADNKQRDAKMDSIKINIDKENNTISVWNNGEGIPVVQHKEEKMYVPTMIFGHLLTSSNYNDEEEKVTGGRNGYGAKLCNIFSSKFSVETSSKEYGLQLKQTWKDNMSKASEPKVTKRTSEDYTKITFSPDLSKFKMTQLEDGIIQLMERRAYDVAATSRGVKVFLNNERIKMKSFKDYAELYVKADEEMPTKIYHEIINDRWEVAFATTDKGLMQVSFVNSIATTKGGRHVDYVVDMIVKHMMEVVKKKKECQKGMQVKPLQIKTHMFVFINCLIVNPTFDSQTKENMTLQASKFGSKCALSDKFLAQIAKSGLVENVMISVKSRALAQLERKGGKKSQRLKGMAKLEDANDAGGRNSIDCTLILTEGDSAKTLAVSGLGVIGRDKYGVFPLRGKLLNVRDATHDQIMKNAEIDAIIKILGLQYKKSYNSRDDLKTLRYGKLMIMTDQDQDGSHIKGLLINFIHFYWPSLLKLDFLEEFITPIVKARKGDTVLSFFSLPEFEEWKRETNNWHTYRIKYYKGLGTSDSQEAKEYFSNMDRHRIKFNYRGAEDDLNIVMAFAKKEVDKRKEWLTNWMESCKRRQELGLPEEYLYEKNTKAINYSEFVNKELVLFSNMDNERSIPSLVDGLKPGQRKVIFTCLKRDDKREVKVAQLAGSVAEHSAYHHGEVSLMGTIVNLAQNYVGSNNINLLLPNGQFGTRLMGGKDSASARYIFTMLNPLTKLIFHPSDTPLLKNLVDDNQKIEPQWYCPIIPMVLVNGVDGIGTGWSTKVPNYNPREIVENLRRMIHGDEPLPMKPWYKGFRGVIEGLADQRYINYGEIAVLDEEQIEITELPIGTWTSAYKESVLETMLNPPKENVQPFITDFKDYSTDTTVRFVVSLSRANLEKAERDGLHKTFKLSSTQCTSFMCLFDELNVLRKYETVQDIMKDFFKVRLAMYQKRKTYMEGFLDAQSVKLQNQARFILEKCDGRVKIENKKKVEMIKELRARGYDPDPERAWKARQDRDALEEEEQGADAADKDDGAADYGYLLGMSLWSLTHEKKEELLKKRDAKIQELKDLQKRSPESLWEEDLSTLLEKLDASEKEEEIEAKKALMKKAKEMKIAGAKGTKPKKIRMSAAEALPDPNGRRIVPVCDEDQKKRSDKYAAAKAAKAAGVAPSRKRKSDGAAAEDKDDVDLMIQGASKSLKDRIGTSPEAIEKKAKGMKQTKLNFKKKDSPKKKPWESEESGDESGDNHRNSESPVPVRERGPRRAAASKVNMKAMLEDSDEENQTDDDELVFVDNTNGASDVGPQYDSKIIVSDSDSEFESKPKKLAKKKDSSDSEDDVHVTKPNPVKAAPPRQSSDQMFDSLIKSGTDSQDDDDFAPAVSKSRPLDSSASDKETKKAPAKKKQLLNIDKPAKKKAPPKKKLPKDSDSDEDIFDCSPVKKKSKSKVDSPDSDMEAAPSSRATTGRSRKPVSYRIVDSDDSDGSD